METLRDYIKIAEAARILGASQNSVRKWSAQGKIPVRVHPANGYRLYRLADLEQFLKKASQPTKRPNKPR